ncbi:MAG: type II 3-dehydroquinate dehydratase [Acidimicrobiia bacterium]
MRFLVINGPNLNLLGSREPDVYGATTLDDLERQIADWGEAAGWVVDTEQSNSEERILDLIQGFDGEGIVINPGALTHTSRAIGDAIRAVGAPVVEVHISDIRAREAWRAESMIADACVTSIYGRGVTGYRDALRHLANRSSLPFETVRYGPHQDNVGDLRIGGGDLVVLAHGGLWRHQFARDGTESLAVDLTGRGFDTWNLEYRRTGAGGGWPASGHDVLMALDFIPQMGLDPDRVVAVGHSAGAHLLMWAAQRSLTPVALHMAMGPLLDLRAAVESGDVGAEECSRMLHQGAPPVMTPGHVETVVVHGEADQIVPVERSVAYTDVQGLQLHQTDCDHFSLLDPTKKEWAWVIDRIGSPA